MNNITINENESQEDNQKTAPVEGSSSESKMSSISLPDSITQIWLGRRDSNPRMLRPKPSALPLGDSPITSKIIA